MGSRGGQGHQRGYLDAPQMNAPEAYIQLTPGLSNDEGGVTEKSTEEFLREFMDSFDDFINHVLTTLPGEKT